jgi:putative acetyltransferase
MMTLVRTNAENDNFLQLVKCLDAELLQINVEDHVTFRPLNALSAIHQAVVICENEHPVACGAMREYSNDTMEIKRMYTLPAARGKRIASQVLMELEKWAVELSYRKCILETGKRLPSAIALYTREGYNRIANYGSYKNVVNSVCFEKELK